MKGTKMNEGFHSSESACENVYYNRLVFESGKKLTGAEPLAGMDYTGEIICKDRAFSTYWYSIGGGCPSSEIIKSPMPRHYRTTTKRRVYVKNKGIILSSDESTLSDAPSLLEPDSHSTLYSELRNMLNMDINRRIAGFLNFIIIRGNYESRALIFNVKTMSSEIVNGLTKIAEKLRDKIGDPSSAFIYHDPEGSKYYLNISSEVEGPRMKRIFGNKNLSIKVNDVIYTFSPESFSQVNLSICGEMLNTAEMLLQSVGKGRLIDLYCGYGFFSCYLARLYDEVVGIDYGHGAIGSAIENMKRTGSRSRFEFHANRIEKRTLNSLLTGKAVSEYLILDPPRNGTAPGVIDVLAVRSPELVLHIFCGLETIPYEIDKWKKCGYRPVRCVPLDMFPGTPELEVMILFKRDHSLKTRSSSKSGR